MTRLLVIDAIGAALDFCLRCTKAGHQVRWYVRPKGDKQRDIGRGLTNRIDEWQSHVKWADMVFLTDCALYMNEMDALRKRGVPVFGATADGAELEMDREIGQDFLMACGVETIPYEVFTDYDRAIRHVRSTGGTYVSKPSGDADKALSYVSKSPADMIFMLERWKRLGKKKAPFILQEVRKGFEFAVGGWIGPNGFGHYWLENFEHKKLMVGDMGPNTGELGCYDAKTEVLTRSGWKFWPDVVSQDELASLVDGALVFQKPSALVSFDYVGHMVTWKNRSLDVCVTPNHNMYVNSAWNSRNGKKAFEFVEAQNCNQSQYEISRSSEWDGCGDEYFELSPITCRKGSGFYTSNAIRIPILQWAKLLGLYVAEGSLTTGGITIAQSHPEKAKKAEKIIAETGLKYIRRQNGFYIGGNQIREAMAPLGLAKDKHAPQYIKEHRKNVIEAFLEGYALGDGHTFPGGFRAFYTCSKILADDIQELLLKIGRVGMVKCRDRIGMQSRMACGRVITCRQLHYEVIERVQKTSGWLDIRDKGSEMYSGKVYCATVSSHVLYVRRNGKPLWCGNTVMKYVETSLLAERVLAPCERGLIDLGITGYVDLNCIVDEQGDAWPLEWTTRPGWPTFSIQAALHQGDPLEWMADLMEGRDTLEVSGDIAVGVVAAIPPFPYESAATAEEVSEFPIFGLDDCDPDNIHLCEVKEGMAWAMEGHEIVERAMEVTAGCYVLVATGHAGSVQAASREAYRTLDKISIPNSPFWRVDIGKRVARDIPKLKELGYCSDWGD